MSNWQLKLRNNTYYAYLYDGVKVHRISLKTSNIKDAEKQIRLLKPPTIPAPPEPKIYTIKECIWKFLLHSEQHHAPSTHKSIKIKFKPLLEYKQDIHTMDVIFCSDLIQQMKSIYQRRTMRSYLFMFFNWCLDMGYVEKNPIIKIKRQKLPQVAPKYIAEKDVLFMASKLDQTNLLESIVHDAMLVGFYTGLRRSELFYLTADQCQNGVIILNNRDHITKSKRIRSIPISAKIQDIIIKRVKSVSDGYLFIPDGFSYKTFPETISRRFSKLAKDCGYKNVAWKILRHSFATALVTKGIGIPVIQRLLGHSDIATTMIYAHVQDSLLSDAILRL